MTMPQLVNGRYELRERIGSGGVSEVYRARDLRLVRDVAVKVLRSNLARDPGFQARFRREAQKATALNHPSIVAVYDTGEDRMSDNGPLPFMVMEYVKGRTLKEVVGSEGRLMPQRALEITADICAALDFSHRNGIIHRDVKPGNVMMTPNGAVKVMGFGIAWDITDDTSALTGTAQYLSPEQARGETVDARSDVYSTGCILYELLCGHPPFTGDSPVLIAYQHVREDPLPPGELNPDVTPQIDAIVLKAMAKKPANRYQSAGEMRADLLRTVAGGPSRGAPATRGHPGSSRPTSVERRMRRKPSRPSATAPRPAPPAPARVVTIKDPEVLRHMPGKRWDENHGDEVYTFDNSKSSSTSTETIRVAHTAKIEVTVEMSKARSVGGQAGVRFLNVASAEGRIQRDILVRHSLSHKQELTFEQTTAISIPASTHVRVVVHWKRVWEEGIVTLGEGATALAEVPYAITVRLRFDKETSDVG